MDEIQSGGQPPLISVVMCAYNGMPYIHAAVQCILDQTYSNWELIISDDGSNDGTREWLTTLADPRIRVFLQEKNLGYVANKNFAHRQARGEYITQMDNDDLCPPDRLAKQYAALQQNKGVRLVAGLYERIDNEGRVYDRQKVFSGGLITSFPGEYPFWFPVLLVHRSVFEEIGYFEEYFGGIYGDDIYWAVRANEKYPIYCINEVLYSYRNNPGSIVNVLTNRRKLIMTDVLDELFRQRKEKGTDWLQQGDLARIEQYEQSLFANKKLMSDKYRLWAAKHIDKGDLDKGRELLAKAIGLHPTSLTNLRTLVYYAKARLRNKKR